MNSGELGQASVKYQKNKELERLNEKYAKLEERYIAACEKE